MQTLSIRTATRETSFDLLGALSRFNAEWARDGEDHFLVSVGLANQQQALHVFDAIRQVVAGNDAECLISCLTVDAELEYPIQTDAASCAAPLGD
jgi:hypothetical protein